MFLVFIKTTSRNWNKIDILVPDQAAHTSNTNCLKKTEFRIILTNGLSLHIWSIWSIQNRKLYFQEALK